MIYTLMKSKNYKGISIIIKLLKQGVHDKQQNKIL